MSWAKMSRAFGRPALVLVLAATLLVAGVAGAHDGRAPKKLVRGRRADSGTAAQLRARLPAVAQRLRPARGSPYINASILALCVSACCGRGGSSPS